MRETAGGHWGLTLTHPLTPGREWTRLQVGALLRVPVPLRETPRMEIARPGVPAEEESIWRVTARVSGIFSEPTFDSTLLKKLPQGTEYHWLWNLTDEWHRGYWDGTAGYLYTPNSEWVRTEIIRPEQ